MRALSVIEKFFISEKSHWKNPGPRKAFRPTAPIVVGSFQTPLHPGGSERKIYAPGVGLVLELSSKGLGHQRRTELISIEE